MKKLKIGWFIQNVNILSASARYRCFYPAIALSEKSFESVFFTREGEVIKALDDLDALVVVKRIDFATLSVVSEAYRLGKPVYLDICDDILAPGYRARPGPWRLAVFCACIPYLNALVVPSPMMANRLKEYMNEYSSGAVPVKVVRDVAETNATVKSAAKFMSSHSQKGRKKSAWARILSFILVTTKLKSQPLSTKELLTTLDAEESQPAPATPAKGRKKILWFGNYGSSHSNFGIVSLLSAVPALEAINRAIPLELVVVSNSKEIFDAVIGQLGIPATYHPWSFAAMTQALRSADVALLTSGNDKFSKIKSSNRALQALAAGVPVVATSNEALAELGDCIVLDDYDAGLRRYLGPEGAEHIKSDLEKYRAIAKRYSIETTQNEWASILKADFKKTKAALEGNTLIVLTKESAKHLNSEKLNHLIETEKDADFLLDTEFLNKNSSMLHVFLEREILPSVVTSGDLVRGAPSRLETARRLILSLNRTRVSATFAKEAESRGVEILDLNTYCIMKGGPAHNETTGIPSDNAPAQKWVFVTHQNTKGWILDAICREIGSRQPDPWKVVYNPPKLPESENYFFSHYSLYLKHWRKNKTDICGKKTFIWHTHPREDSPEEIQELVTAFNEATKIIFACSEHYRLWVERGMNPDKGALILGGADPELFKHHERKGKVVGLSSAFYQRKNPDLLYALVKQRPDWEFILLGRNWEQYRKFDELRNSPNFEYVTAPYSEYPEYYSRFDILLSASKIEGGPIPLLEAMMSNVVPVSSKTGFAPDLIRHGENGYLFDIDAAPADVVKLIELALDLKTDVRATVIDYSWNNFAKQILDLSR
ncbi:glycosyltransferase [Roseibium polysiphoniae]|uniref:Glycosyltransferase n=1 Tax=Roseibium polysiphoniae TaxID=2571221 RepID=A0A944CJB4_9HYPH|nr:glycosyltransferase [Roseibium polysiphoniae]MBS8262803.1 glycosyltransferase [Roseibium polysiphoniae]